MRNFYVVAISALVLVGPSVVIAGQPGRPRNEAYSLLSRYNGKWIFAPRGGRTSSLENRCERTGFFYVCEQILDGKSAALVVFRPQAPTAKGWSYSSRALLPSGEGGAIWSPLTIEGDEWIFGPSKGVDGKQAFERTVNRFDGPDHIRYESQTSADGDHWVTQSSGDEQRRR